VDVSNLYYTLQKKYSRKLDFRKLRKYVDDLGEVKYAIAYGSQMGNQAEVFLRYLHAAGYETKFKEPKTYHNEGDAHIRRKADWDVGITMDIVTRIEKIDMLVIGSSDGDMVPVVEWAMNQGVYVLVMGAKISGDLRKASTAATEIPESLLEEKK
jgi:uncharacterized LabA/DUF88 family protein